jgi:hypothetical protein
LLIRPGLSLMEQWRGLAGAPAELMDGGLICVLGPAPQLRPVVAFGYMEILGERQRKWERSSRHLKCGTEGGGRGWRWNGEVGVERQNCSVWLEIAGFM